MPDPTLNESGMTELHLACYYGELDWVRNCLNGGLSVHAQDNRGYTPLHWVVDMGLVDGEREAIVAALLKAEANPNARDSSGKTIFDTAHRVDATYLIHLLEQNKDRGQEN